VSPGFMAVIAQRAGYLAIEQSKMRSLIRNAPFLFRKPKPKAEQRTA
jgi:hypothetical protein